MISWNMLGGMSCCKVQRVRIGQESEFVQASIG